MKHKETDMRTKLLPVATSLLLTLPMAAFAADRGVNEIAGSAAYTDIGQASTTTIDLSYGYYFTPQHEAGVTLGYTNTDVDGLGSLDGTTLGAFYQFNFDNGGNLVPFLGVDLAYIGGDIGDAYDYSYGASAGVKFYPYEHVGVLMGVSYMNMVGAENYIDDEDGFNVNVGLSLRF